LRKLMPDLVAVYGDTNSTLGGALAAAQEHLPLAHIEAGLRCFDLSVAEELNRVVTDHISAHLFCPTPHSRENLRKEGITKQVHLSGDILYDVVKIAKSTTAETKAILQQYDLSPGQYLFLTCHRAETVDDKRTLSRLVMMISSIREPVIFPIHPRTKKNFRRFGLYSKLTGIRNLRLVDPCSYRESLALIGSARMVVTDSGGVQREAYYLKVPTLLLRDVTEWVEILKSGGSMIVGMDSEKLRYGLSRKRFRFENRSICKLGAAARIASMLSQLS
jgi:UDP-GlcNAc3NAcA epimerase